MEENLKRLDTEPPQSAQREAERIITQLCFLHSPGPKCRRWCHAQWAGSPQSINAIQNHPPPTDMPTGQPDLPKPSLHSQMILNYVTLTINANQYRV